MKPIKLKIDTKTQQYPIIVGSYLSSNIAKIIKDDSISFNQCLLVVDANVPKKIVSKIKKSFASEGIRGSGGAAAPPKGQPSPPFQAARCAAKKWSFRGLRVSISRLRNPGSGLNISYH